MTLPPERIGDKGQRYEVNSLGRYGRVGWSPTLKGAREMRDAILTAPSCTEAWIVDRDTGERVE